MLEREFRDRQVRPWLDQFNCYYFIKEAAAIRGILDISGCLHGYYFSLELKRNKAEANKTKGGIALQKREVERIKGAGGFAAIVYPENWEEIKKELLAHLLPSHRSF